MSNETTIVPIKSAKGTSYRCVHRRCASNGNRVTVTHVHKFVEVQPMSNDHRELVYLTQSLHNGKSKLTARQERAIRRAKRRATPKVSE